MHFQLVVRDPETQSNMVLECLDFLWVSLCKLSDGLASSGRLLSLLAGRFSQSKLDLLPCVPVEHRFQVLPYLV